MRTGGSAANSKLAGANSHARHYAIAIAQSLWLLLLLLQAVVSRQRGGHRAIKDNQAALCAADSVQQAVRNSSWKAAHGCKFRV